MDRRTAGMTRSEPLNGMNGMEGRGGGGRGERGNKKEGVTNKTRYSQGLLTGFDAV
jgi:hypothetical protein